MQLNNIITIIFLSFFILIIIIKILLDIDNYLYRKKNGNIIPQGFEDLINQEKLTLINNYSNEKMIFSNIEYFFDKVFILSILFFGIIPIFCNFIFGITSNIYFTGLLFFGGFYFFQLLIDIPFSLYFNFKIEKKYNFNKMTLGLWITDLIKKIILSVVLGIIILIPLLFILYNFKNIWWILLWVFFILFSLIIQIIYPLIIAPIFNKFKPLEDKELQNKIEDLLLKTGFKFNGVFEMDASKRSSHSNAYFTGIGKSKRIVLFDVLLKNHTHEEILAVLAHELGHYKHKHIIINFFISSIISFIGLFITYLFLNYKPIYTAFGFNTGIDFEKLKFIGLFLISILVGPIGFFFNPFTNILSRFFEYQADRYSVKIMHNSNFIIDALKKLSIQNLSNIYPSPLYAWFYYSHPPILARIKRLKNLENINE